VFDLETLLESSRERLRDEGLKVLIREQGVTEPFLEQLSGVVSGNDAQSLVEIVQTVWEIRIAARQQALPRSNRVQQTSQQRLGDLALRDPLAALFNCRSFIERLRRCGAAI